LIDLDEFARESNHIEGISGVSLEDTGSLSHLMSLPHLNVWDLERLVERIQPGALLRKNFGMDVRVGMHVPPGGGPYVPDRLKWILENLDDFTPFQAHQLYETLHPFTDGNGRSGRALWLWQMNDLDLSASLGFLHTYYYQSLSDER